ncbi:hypothetical protein ACJRO7_012679, partial [Eucalyptus globulus]
DDSSSIGRRRPRGMERAVAPLPPHFHDLHPCRTHLSSWPFHLSPASSSSSFR